VESGRSRSAYGFFTFHLFPSTWFGRQASVLRVLLGIGGGLWITTDDASSLIRLNQLREAKVRRVRELE
jgi:hypothetical protein